jgi:hypothetical protein
MKRPLSIFAMMSVLMSVPVLGQTSETPPDIQMLKMISRYDPETDPILAVIRTAILPSEEQMASILKFYRTLREEQQQAFLETMVQRMDERKGTSEAEGTAIDGDPIMPEVFEHIGRANRSFLESTRGILRAEQLPLWDACAGDLQLQPMGNFPPGQGGNIDPAKEGPQVGVPVPSFSLADLEGRVVTLESLRGKPLVIEFGSLSCPMFRGKVDPFRELAETFGDRVHWVVIYTREAHAAGTPRVAMINPVVGIEIAEHTTFAERVASALRLAEDLDLSRTLLVDDLDDSVTRAFGGFPNWGFLLDAEGNLVARQVWSDPAQIGRLLKDLLPDQDPPGV